MREPRVAWAVSVGASSALLVTLVVLLVDPPRPQAAAAPAGRLELVGHEPLLMRGMNSALAVHGRYAYVGSRTDGSHPNAGVLVVDISKPASPRVVHQIGQPHEANLGESSRELRVWPEKDLLIVMNFECDEVGHACAGSSSEDVEPAFRFYDIAGGRAARPVLVSTYHPSRNPHEFFLWDDPRHPGRALLYVTTPFVEAADIDHDGPHLVVTDISDARRGRFRELVRFSPRREERFKAAGIHSLSVSPGGRRAFLADLEGGFLVVDTTDLARGRPRPRIHQITPPQRAVHHEEPGAHSALQLPGRPYALITDEVYGAAFGLGSAIGFNVLKGCPWGWARLIDVRDPSRPRIAGEYKLAEYNDPKRCPSKTPTQENGASFSSHNPTLTPHLAVISWHSAGLEIATIADPRKPRQAAEFRPAPLPAAATEDPALSAGTEKVVMWSYPIVQNGLIYVVDLRNGLYVLRYRGPYADELRCYAFLEGNSNATRPRRTCGLRLALDLRYTGGRDESDRACTDSDVRAALRGRDTGRVDRVRFRVSGRLVATDEREPFVRHIRLRHFRRDGSWLTLEAITSDGTPIPLGRTIRRCR